MPSVVLCLVAQLCPALCNPMDCSLPGSSVHGDSPGKNTGGGCRALLQGVFPTQELNPGLPHCRCILYPLSHHGSPGKTTELISEFGKIAGYRINAHLVLGFCLFGINAQKSLAVFKTLWTIADQALLSIGF